MLFCDSRRQIGGISLIWTRGSGSSLRQKSDIAANVHRYIETNYRQAWRGTAFARRHRMADELRLTPRETDVVELLCDGKTNTEIADQLQASLSTIKCHLNHIFHKVGVSNRAALVRHALGGCAASRA
jgi:DNA-binding NarL/FixJ family response regulator